MERIQWVYIDSRPLNPDPVRLAPGQTHAFTAQVFVVETDFGEPVESPTIDTSVSWFVRLGTEPFNETPPVTVDPSAFGTVSSSGLYTAPSVVPAFPHSVLVYAVANAVPASSWPKEGSFTTKRPPQTRVQFMTYCNRRVEFLP